MDVKSDSEVSDHENNLEQAQSANDSADSDDNSQKPGRIKARYISKTQLSLSAHSSARQDTSKPVLEAPSLIIDDGSATG